MQIILKPASLADASDILEFKALVAKDITAKHGKGLWSSFGTERGILYSMKISTTYIAKVNNKVIASLTLSERKPWAIDRKYFTNCNKPVYLTSMAVKPGMQRKGIGRICIDEIQQIAKNLSADAICLDAFEAPAGAGDFYGKCGFKEVGRVVYRNNPLIYFEMLL